jgi:lysophospholipase L1-like esterase
MEAQTRLNRLSTGFGEVHYLFLELEGSTVSRLVTTLSILLLSTASIQSYALQSEYDAGVSTVAAQLEAKRKDCPSLSTYRDSNAKLPLSTKDETRAVFLGNSITAFWADHGFGEFFVGKPYINRGISGELTSVILCRFRSDVIAIKPRVVVILAGTNDIRFANLSDVAGITRPSTFQVVTDNLVSMAELARANDILVVFASLLPVSDYDKDKDGKQIINTDLRPPAQIKTLNDWIKAYAARSGHTYLDYHSAMRDEKGFLRDELSDDGLHPNDNGYAVMAPLAEQAIATAQKSKRSDQN